jgi:hypothetical protein
MKGPLSENQGMTLEKLRSAVENGFDRPDDPPLAQRTKGTFGMERILSLATTALEVEYREA